jgi:hypothetical protein
MGVPFGQFERQFDLNAEIVAADRNGFEQLRFALYGLNVSGLTASSSSDPAG